MNVVFILSDQHNPFYTGCCGHPLARTPNIDRLAAEGVRFAYAYCASPLCVPARASLFTGRYVHEHCCWDNAQPWDGRLQGWSHYFREEGILLVTVGKLDFAPGADHGIERELLPAHRESLDIHALYREQEIGVRWAKRLQLLQSGPREDIDENFHHDTEVTARAVSWLKKERPTDRPWVLNVNLSQPHPGWPCPPRLWEKWNALVTTESLPPRFFEELERLHPYHRDFSRHQTGAFASMEEVRRCNAAYLAHCEMADANVGRICAALEEEGILRDTLVIYASDHGETCGAHRMFGKMSQYEDSIRIPLVAAGPGVARGRVEYSPVSHIDIFPTIAEAVGAGHPEEFRGISLWGMLRGEKNALRNAYVLSEYHANGFRGGAFAVSDGRMKYVECVGERPMLFDLESDPEELHDLVRERPAEAAVNEAVKRFRAWLYTVCSPPAVDLRAKRDQAVLRERLERSGRLAEEIYKRGYERVTERLVPRQELVPEWYETGRR